PGAGAGIWIHSRGGEQHPSCTVRITNCVITDNIVGIALDSFVDGLIGVPQRPRIVNNTVAWNRVGLWAGEAGALPAQPSNHSPVIINNIFDSGTPPAATIVGLDGFQGLDANDLQVV